MERIRGILFVMRGQFWLLPSLMSGAGIGAALLVLGSSWNIAPGDANLWWLYSGDASAARDLLASLLSGMMTMTSLVISITFVILTLSANQLGPRLIWNFIGDWQIQAVLGLFLSTIFYILIVLRSLNETIGPDGIPHLAVTAASGLTAACLFALLFYLHKVARSIVSDTVVQRVGEEFRAAVAAMLEDGREADKDPEASPGQASRDFAVLSLQASGYVQSIDYGALLDLATHRNLRLRIPIRAGHFVLERGEHVMIEDARAVPETLAAEIRAAFTVGANRNPAQDLEYTIRQLVEIGLRALSSGINDAYTAMSVIDRLSIGLEDILRRSPQLAVLRDRGGTARIRANRSDTNGFMDAAFNQIRQAARGQPAILIHLADTIGKLAKSIRDRAAREAALRQLDRLDEEAGLSEAGASDRAEISARIQEARKAVLTAAPV